ncbi:MAG: SH3 domain-containing protein [Rhodoferax sp.]
MTGLRTVALLLGAAMVTLAQAQTESVVIKRPSELREEPNEGARSLQNLGADTALTRLPQRQGAWIQVRTASGSTGWVHLFDVSAATAPSNSATGALRGLSNFFNRGSASKSNSTATATVGIRGLGAEDLAQAQPNLLALAQMDGLHQDAREVRRFAAEAQWQARKVDPLPVPATPGGTAGNARSAP